MTEHNANPSQAVLVIGGGIAGIKAAMDLAEAGRKVYLIDKSPTLGGYLPLLDRQFPTNDCNICYVTPDAAKAGARLDITALPLTNLTKLDGEAGRFTASLETAPRYIDVDLCTACGDCLKAAPAGAVKFDPGLDHRSPTCLRYPQAVPEAYSIDKAKVGEDTSWTACCQPGAIALDMEAQASSIAIGSVIVATGAELFDPSPMHAHLGYGVYPDVVTSLEFERILSSAGPTGGVFARPSDAKEPLRIGWMQCVGSRTTVEPGNPYCSSICCMFAMKEAIWAKERFAEDLDATIFYMDIRPMGKDYEQYYLRAKDEVGIGFVRGRPHTITRDESTGELILTYATPEGKEASARLDMVVLATGFCAAPESPRLAEALGIDLDQYRFVAASDWAPVETTRPGVYACGMALGPRDIPDSLVQASAAACLASRDLEPPQSLSPERDLPPERDVSGEESRVGVYFADQGGNVRSAMDLEAVMASAESLPGVVHVAELADTAGGESLDTLVGYIAEHDLNRVVIAGYSPRTHGLLFAETIRRAGLNRAMVEMANIRDQVAMVHFDQPAVATAKAADLVRMAVARVKLARPIYPYRQEVTRDALVVGGGVAGMSAALVLADQGIPVHLVERSPELGGLARRVKRTFDGQPVDAALDALVARVKDHDKINLITDALVVDHAGTVGNFTTGVQSGPGMYYQQIRHGVTILATGALPLRTTEYLYGGHPGVMTQMELGERLAAGDGSEAALETVVMIQCVGSRNETNPACGRICCQSAIKNALWLKELNPEAQVIILYRDMRTPYISEDRYRECREKGVLFGIFDPANPPVVSDQGGLSVTFTDHILGRPVKVLADAVALSVPQVADDEATEELCEIFRLQQTDTGFLLEENIKVRPVDTPAPGVFAAGSVLAPKSIAEARTQGLAAAGRALTLLSQEALTISGGVAKVKGEICAACLVCVRACPVGVPFINADGYSEIDPAKCIGCGVCAAECPAKAIQLQGYSDDQILGMTEALLEGVL